MEPTATTEEFSAELSNLIFEKFNKTAEDLNNAERKPKADKGV